MVAAVVAATALVSCTADEPAARPAPATVSGRDSAEASPSASESSEPPGPGEMETPGTTAGELSRRSFPTPRQLGHGWKYSVDAGDAEEGYLGNGTPALERNPREVVAAAVPFGCPRAARMPTPAHALEVDYSAEGVKVIAIRADFGDDATARSFFEGRAESIRACEGRDGGQAIGVLVGSAHAWGDGVLVSDRTPRSDPWVELSMLDDDQVVLLAAQTTLDTPPVTNQQARRLARAFRR